MIRIRLDTTDLSQIRFAFSPLSELEAAFRLLKSGEKNNLHHPWMQTAQAALKGVDLSLLNALVNINGYTPDFIAPPPDQPFSTFETEILRMLNTPHEIVRSEVSHLFPPVRSYPPHVQVFFDNPSSALEQLAATMTTVWERTLSQHWPRLYTLLEGDVLYRAHRLAFGGPEAVFSDLHSLIRYRDKVIEIDKPHVQEVKPDGRGVLLIPSIFAWPELYVVTDGLWQPTIVYAPRGLAGLWTFAHHPPKESLTALLGSVRADILKTVSIPATTSELARRLGITPGAVSQQLSLLKKSALVEATRQGKNLYYRLSYTGQALLDLYGETD